MLSKSVFLRFLFLYIQVVCIVRWQNKHYKLKLLSRTCGPCCSLKYYRRAESVKIKESKWSTLSDRGMNPSYDVAHLHLFV